MKAGKLNKKTVRKAVVAILDYISRTQKGGKRELIDNGETIYVQIGLKKIPEKGSNKPVRISIPNTLYSPEEGSEMCLIVKESSKKEIKEKLLAEPVEGLSKVIGLEKLRKVYHRYEDKRKLCSAFDLFLADDRILPMLPKALGKTFFNKKKQPVPVRVNRPSLRQSIELARDSTYLYIGWGPCSALRVAHTRMEIDQIVDNVFSAVQESVQAIPKQWKNIQNIHVKTASSISLPIYNDIPDIGLKIQLKSAEAGVPTKERQPQDDSDSDGGNKKTIKKRKLEGPTVTSELRSVGGRKGRIHAQPPRTSQSKRKRSIQ